MSTTYYALFHSLARCCADAFMGGTSADRSDEAWRQVYRALEHGVAKNACQNHGVMANFPEAIVSFADGFVKMQAKRHSADYDPSPTEALWKSAVLQDIDETEQIIRAFEAAPMKDRRAFATHVLLKVRRD